MLLFFYSCLLTANQVLNRVKAKKPVYGKGGIPPLRTFSMLGIPRDCELMVPLLDLFDPLYLPSCLLSAIL